MIKLFNKDIVFLLLAVLLTFFAIKPLLVPGFFPIHDNEQVARLYELNLDVKAWQLPPRLAPDLGFGFDYPLFNFYPSFVYYVAEIFHLIGFGYIISIKLMITVGYILAAIFMFLLAKEFFGKIAGVVSAVAYTYAPYHSVDVYVRGALPEFWAFVFLPALFWAMTKLQQSGKRRYMIFVSLTVAGFLLTHNLIAMMSAIFVVLFFFYLFFTSKKRRKFFWQTSISGFLGILLSAYFWLPALIEKKFTLVNLLTTELANFQLYFVCPSQFWNSAFLYGGSEPGCIDGMSFQLGKLHIIFVTLALFICLFFILLKKFKKRGLVLLFLIFLLLSLFMQISQSDFIWERFQPFWYIQFPWRFLLLSAFFMSFLIAAFIAPFKKLFQVPLAIIIIMGLILFNKKYFVPQTYLSNVTDKDYVSKQIIRWDVSKMSYEYSPIGIATKKDLNGVTIVDISKNQIYSKPYTIIKGQASVKVLSDLPQTKSFNISSTSSTILQVNVFAFPGWQIYLDNKQIDFKPSHKLHLITVSIPAGSHEVRANFSNTSIRTIANLMSVFGVLSLLIICFPFVLPKKLLAFAPFLA